MDYCYICNSRYCIEPSHIHLNQRLQMQMMQQQGALGLQQHFQSSLQTYPTEIIDNERNKNIKNKKLLLLRK